MPSLSSLLADHGPLLVLDASSLRVQVGLVRPQLPPLWNAETDEAGTGIFAAVARLLDQAKLPMDAIGAFLYCEGPGSMLGVRTVAMALRTWQTLKSCPVYAYQSLTLAAHYARRQNIGTELIVITDARRDAWHCVHIADNGTIGPLQRLATPDLPQKLPWLTPDFFRSWSQAPRMLQPTSYNLETIFKEFHDVDFFRPAPSPDVFQTTTTVYKKWSALIHQAPATTS